MAVDHCFSIKGQGTVMTGTILSGSVSLGDNVEIPALKVSLSFSFPLVFLIETLNKEESVLIQSEVIQFFSIFVFVLYYKTVYNSKRHSDF